MTLGLHRPNALGARQIAKGYGGRRGDIRGGGEFAFYVPYDPILDLRVTLTWVFFRGTPGWALAIFWLAPPFRYPIWPRAGQNN